MTRFGVTPQKLGLSAPDNKTRIHVSAHSCANSLASLSLSEVGSGNALKDLDKLGRDNEEGSDGYGGASPAPFK